MIKKIALLLLAFSSSWMQAHKIGLCIMATGRYDVYAERFIESARKYFFKVDEVTYFVFTDGHIKPSPDVVQVFQKRLGWPQDTLMRFSVYAQHHDLFTNMDYVFASDADMLFVAPVGQEILGKRVATMHPGFVGRRGTYETDKRSTAYVAPREGKHYYAGGFYGAQTDEFIKMMRYLKQKIEEDFAKGIIAIWHDESHWNRYCIDFPPRVVLSAQYCCPETWDIPNRKLLALDKNHEKMRK